jgi:hypothetical protein
MNSPRSLLPALLAVLVISRGIAGAAEALPLRVGTFDVDASPPVGAPMAYDPVKGIETPLTCRGLVLLGADRPVVLCALDWIGLSNGGQTAFREALAQAAGTDPHHVAVHALHQHDAPRCDFSADELLLTCGVKDSGFDARWARDVIRRAADAVHAAAASAQPVTHLGLGEGTVEMVASNRRILGPDGKVLYTRYTATKDPKIREYPVGTIDPILKLITFWNGERAIVAVTFYATHPQSYYRTGLANADFPGLARTARDKETGVLHVHFDGAGGNVGAGKWNDGAPENRQILADRVAAGMKRAWDQTQRSPITAADVGWNAIPVLLPVADHLHEGDLLKLVADDKKTPSDRFEAAKHLTWLRRCQQRDPIDLGCLKLKNARVLFMPGELFVEYQLAAQQLRPDLFVAMAAYGEYAPGYIGTEIAYSQGGYEASPGASKVAPLVEEVLLTAMKQLLNAP